MSTARLNRVFGDAHPIEMRAARLKAILSTTENRRSFMFARFRLFIILSILCFGGCNTVGPKSIQYGRANYNEAIQETSREQTFMNLVRVANHDTTLFMDVTEVDTQLTSTVSLSAAAMLPQSKSGGGGSRASTIGGTSSGQTVSTDDIPYFPGHDFSITGMTSYSEAPTIKYVPLSGQPLIAQISTPITPDSLAYLFDSEWPIGTVLTMVAERLTARYGDYYRAMFLIEQLDDQHELVYSPTSSSSAQPPTSKSSATGFLTFLAINNAATIQSGTSDNTQDSSGGNQSGSTNNQSPSAKNTALALYYAPDPTVPDESEDWSDLRQITHPAMPTTKQADSAKNDNSEIDLSTTPTKEGGRVQMPVLHARSGLGVLRAATNESWQMSVIMSAEDFKMVSPLIELLNDPTIIGNLSVPIGNLPVPIDPEWGDVTEIEGIIKSYQQLEDTLAPEYKPIPPPSEQSPQLKSILHLRKLAASLNKAGVKTAGGKDFCAADVVRLYLLQEVGRFRVQNEYYAFDAEQLPSYASRGLSASAPSLNESVTAAFTRDRFDRDVKVALFNSLIPKGQVSPLPLKPDVTSLYFDPSSIDALRGWNRHFVIIVCQDWEPADSIAFVKVPYGSKWYYIANNDNVSKRNLQLITQLLTMQAVASQNNGLQSTISVGAH